jgi:hypothetical protein
MHPSIRSVTPLELLVLAASFVQTVVSQAGCPANCEVRGYPGSAYWASWKVSGLRGEHRTSTINAITVVTIINTDLGTTRTTEIFDADKLPFPINDQGTQIQRVTYTIEGSPLVTEV